MACDKSLKRFCRQVVVLLFVLVQPSDCAQATRIKSLYACTDIKYRFATTRISSHVTNPTNQSRHAVFDITLPNDAFISNFTLTVDGQTYPGRVEERGQALRQYGSNATQGPFSSGRVTQRPRETNKFRVTLKVAPFQGVTFNLTYQEILERRLGFYDHVLYIYPGQPVDDLRVDVSIEENRPITYLHVPPIRSDLLTDFDISETNSLVRVERPNSRHAYISYHPSARQQQLQGMSLQGLSGLFSVRYDVSRSMDAGELLSVNGYFVHFIAPTVQDIIPKDVLFILDTSTSMMWQKLSQLQEAMRVILNDLNPGDRFALMQFNSRATFWRRELLPVTKRTISWALQYVDSLKARGYTNIDSALAQGLEFFNEESTVKGNNSLIIFLTDGRSTRGETDRGKILRHAREKNMKNVTIYGLAFGKDADWPLVKKMASQNYGVGRRIYQDADAALQIQGFYNEVSTLLLTGVQAVYLDSEVDMDTLTRTLFRKFFNGSEMVVAGKLIRLNQTALQVYVEATGLKGEVNLTVVPDPDPLSPGQVRSCGLLKAKDLTKVAEKMWAYLTIRQLLQQKVGEDDKLTKQQLKDRATQLALRYNFVTPVTSLVVSKPGAEELAFLEEDASELVDELDIWTFNESVTTLPKSTTTTLRTTMAATTVPPPATTTATKTTTTAAAAAAAATTTKTPQKLPKSLSASEGQTLVLINDTVSAINKTGFPERPTLPKDPGSRLGNTTLNLPVKPISSETSTVKEGNLPPVRNITNLNVLPDKSTSPESSSVVPKESDKPLRNANTFTTPERSVLPDGSHVSSDPDLPVGNTSPTLPEGHVLPERSTVPAERTRTISEAEKAEEKSASPDGKDIPEEETPTLGLTKEHALPTHLAGNATIRGGGGGDPHFMVEMTSLAYPLCYDVRGDSGDVFQLLRDPETGLTVNVEIGKGHRKLPGSSRFPVYITRAAILLQDVIADVSDAHVKVNDNLLQWGTSQSVYLPGVWVMMKNSTLRFALDWNVEIDVTRYERHWANQNGETFLNVEIQNEAKLSKDSTGLLGQFVHKDVRLQRIKKRHGRFVAELEIMDERGGHPYISHGRALLRNRRDPYFRRLASCLMVDSLWSHTLDRPTRFYKVRSLYEI